MKKQRTNEQFEKDSKLLKEIVTKYLEVDITENIRKRDIVDARAVYAKILHDKGYSYPMIGKSLGRDHSTVIHHVRNLNNLMFIIEDLNTKYTLCRDEFFAMSKVTSTDSRFEMYKDEIMHLKKRLEYIEYKEKELSNLDLKYKRLQNIIKFIDENTESGEEEKVKCKIYAVFKS